MPVINCSFRVKFIFFEYKKGLGNPEPFFIFNPAVTYFPMTLAIRVSSAQKGLTSVFGMGTGVAPSA